jgi:hypothetical protein
VSKRITTLLHKKTESKTTLHLLSERAISKMNIMTSISTVTILCQLLTIRSSLSFAPITFIATRSYVPRLQPFECHNRHQFTKRTNILGSFSNDQNEIEINNDSSVSSGVSEVTSAIESNAATISRRKKRVRRKEEVISDGEINTEIMGDDSLDSLPLAQQQQVVAPEISLTPRQESRVAMKVLDLRDLTQPGTITNDNKSFNSSDKSKTNNKATALSRASTSIVDDYDEDDIDNKNYDSMDPIQRMLIDAKRMQSKEDEKNDSGLSNSEGTDGEKSDVGNSIRNVISSIVTIDFFVVFGFFLWFLAGIFSSYILKVSPFVPAYSSIAITLFLCTNKITFILKVQMFVYLVFFR